MDFNHCYNIPVRGVGGLSFKCWYATQVTLRIISCHFRSIGCTSSILSYFPCEGKLKKEIGRAFSSHIASLLTNKGYNKLL